METTAGVGSTAESTIQTGVTSAKYADRLTNLSSSNWDNFQKSGVKVYRVKYDYDPVEFSPNFNPEDELQLTVGDYVYIYGKADEVRIVLTLPTRIPSYEAFELVCSLRLLPRAAQRLCYHSKRIVLSIYAPIVRSGLK